MTYVSLTFEIQEYLLPLSKSEMRKVEVSENEQISQLIGKVALLPRDLSDENSTRTFRKITKVDLQSISYAFSRIEKTMHSEVLDQVFGTGNYEVIHTSLHEIAFGCVIFKSNFLIKVRKKGKTWSRNALIIALAGSASAVGFQRIDAKLFPDKPIVTCSIYVNELEAIVPHAKAVLESNTNHFLSKDCTKLRQRIWLHLDLYNGRIDGKEGNKTIAAARNFSETHSIDFNDQEALYEKALKELSKQTSKK